MPEEPGSAIDLKKAQRSASASKENVDGQAFQLLIVEDNRADVFVIQEAIREYNIPAVLHVVDDGEKAISFLERAANDDSAPCPQMLLLDLNLPKKTGLEVLAHVRQSSVCSQVPVVVVTSSDSPRDRDAAARLGATQYFCKPSNYTQFLKLGAILRQLLTGSDSTAQRY
ncbi:MAG: response regulator receiver protein [Bryobacterales bacterium]|nr:response regulator receiver protein [Bryobacterales bacterium]